MHKIKISKGERRVYRGFHYIKHVRIDWCALQIGNHYWRGREKWIHIHIDNIWNGVVEEYRWLIKKGD